MVNRFPSDVNEYLGAAETKSKGDLSFHNEYQLPSGSKLWCLEGRGGLVEHRGLVHT